MCYGSLCSLKLDLVKSLEDCHCLFKGMNKESQQEMYELKLKLIRGASVSLNRGIKDFDEGTSSSHFHDVGSAAPPRDFSQLVRKLSRNPEPNFLVRPALPHRVGKFEAALSSCRLCGSSPRLFRRLPADAAPSKIRKLPRLASRNPRRTARVRKTSPSGRAPPLPPPEPKDATRVRKSAVARSCPTRFPAATRPASARASACSELVHLPALCPNVVDQLTWSVGFLQQGQALQSRSWDLRRLGKRVVTVRTRRAILQPIRVVPAWVSFGITTYLGLCGPTGRQSSMDIDMIRVIRRGPRISIVLVLLPGSLQDTEDRIFVPTGAHVARVRERARDWVEAEVGAKASWRATRSDRGEP
ncbi:hypothetical protein E5676_scaffold120G001260 [Cucumis melo var. makuwa]|uniref:Uncharacterized protein n=1 Tax=Cucumis melo var. makuwa TaxID=1194695 RepID=A0A5D3E0M1_CUCMM|nr:hypothetical protein E5676_scaffold120G001260 [Cucumis melo var. makuwa]